MWTPFFDPAVDGLCKLIACILFELIITIASLFSSLTIVLGQYLSGMILFWAYWLATVVSKVSTAFWLAAYFSFSLQITTMSPFLSWFFVSVAWLAVVVQFDSTEVIIRDQEDGARILLTEAWLAWSVLVLLDMAAPAKPHTPARHLQKPPLRRVEKALQVELLPYDSLVRCYKPARPRPPFDQHSRSLVSELHKPELRLGTGHMKKPQNESKCKLPGCFIDLDTPTARRKLWMPTRNATPTERLDSDHHFEQSWNPPKVLARRNVFREGLQMKDVAPKSTDKGGTDVHALVPNAQHSQDIDESIEGERVGRKPMNAQKELDKNKVFHQKQPVSSPIVNLLEPTESDESVSLELERFCNFASGGRTAPPLGFDNKIECEDSNGLDIIYAQDIVEFARKYASKSPYTFELDPVELPEDLREFEHEEKEFGIKSKDPKEPEGDGPRLFEFEALAQWSVSLGLTGKGPSPLYAAAKPEAIHAVVEQTAWPDHGGDPMQEDSGPPPCPEPHPFALVFEGPMEEDFAGVPMELELTGSAFVPDDSLKWEGHLNIRDSPAEVDGEMASLQAMFRGLSLCEAPTMDEHMTDAFDDEAGSGASLKDLKDRKTFPRVALEVFNGSVGQILCNPAAILADDVMTDAPFLGLAPTLDATKAEAQGASGVMTSTQTALFADNLV